MSKKMKPAPYRFDKDDEFRTPPPFVQCDCVDGKYTRFVKSGLGSALNGAEYELTEPCGICSHSPLPGWLPQYYTPEQYRDWIRRENGLPDYELPDSVPVWYKSDFDGEWRTSYIEEGNRMYMMRHTVVRTEAGRPPEDWKPNK